MHQCLKCGRTVSTLTEIEEGCECGSKVFVFTRHGLAHPAPAESAHPILPANGGASKPAAPSSQKKSGLTFLPSIQKVLGKPESESATPARPSKKDEVVIEPALGEKDGPIEILPAQTHPAPSKNNLSPPKSEAAQSASPPSPSPSAVASAPIAVNAEEPASDGKAYEEVWLSKGGRIQPLGPAQTVSEDGSAIENIRQVMRGVYEVNVTSLREGPVVVRDSDGIYYIRLPFAQLPDMLTKEKE